MQTCPERGQNLAVQPVAQPARVSITRVLFILSDSTTPSSVFSVGAFRFGGGHADTPLPKNGQRLAMSCEPRISRWFFGARVVFELEGQKLAPAVA